MINAYSPSMRKTAMMLAAIFGLASLLMVTGVAGAKTTAGSGVAVPVSGTLSDGGSFTGKILNPVVTADKSGNTFLSGTLKGTATTASGATSQVSQAFKTSLTPSTGQNAAAAGGGKSCSILTLDVGAINLNLLGLVVNLAPIHLDVSAVPGAGNLLGNLLCAVTNLLNNTGSPTSAITNLLNQLLTGLFG